MYLGKKTGTKRESENETSNAHPLHDRIAEILLASCYRDRNIEEAPERSFGA
jgi:hypothetical protein